MLAMHLQMNQYLKGPSSERRLNLKMKPVIDLLSRNDTIMAMQSQSFEWF
jgi:hypothetical protein